MAVLNLSIVFSKNVTHLKKLIFLCIKNFGVKLERSTIVCAINLIEEVLESSSSSDDEEDEIYAYRSFQINNWKTFFSIFVATEHRIKAEGASYLLRHRFCHFCDLAPEVIKFSQTIEEKLLYCVERIRKGSLGGKNKNKQEHEMKHEVSVVSEKLHASFSFSPTY
ncbi:hypothetical protein FF38_01674 [Lucilia cuprina]|uniref:Uncharacterized protein n=1 Tax=Lucilia cuprina TaxID=7375 RepID=A0A0L0C1W2_LUCCU|nr:hypothetical protein FF38_01674 [Lucilia cuprina]